MEDRRRRILIIIIVILGFIRGCLDTQADASLYWTIIDQLRTVYDLDDNSVSQGLLDVLTASDLLCDAVYTNEGDLTELSSSLASKLSAL